MIKIEKSRKKPLETLATKSLPFAKSKQNAWRRRYYYTGKPANRDQDSRVRFEIIAEGNFNNKVKNVSSEHLKAFPFTKNSKLVPLASMTMIQPVLRKLFIEEIPNVLLTFGGYPGSKKSSRGISVQLFSCWKEGWGELHGDKFEKTQYIHLLRTLQNGRFALSKISSRAKWFHVQNRSQRRLLLNSFQQAIIKICEIQVVKQPLRVYLPLFWFRTNSTSFHQITKNLNNNCLSRRYVTDEVDLTRSCDSEGCIDFSAAKFGVSHESGIVNSSTSEANGIYGVADKCRGNDIVSNNRNWLI